MITTLHIYKARMKLRAFGEPPKTVDPDLEKFQSVLSDGS